MLPKEVEHGDLVRVIKGSEVIEGIVLPSTEFSSEDIIVLKLPSGYNIGVSTRGARFEVLRKGAVRISPEVPMGRTAISGNGDLRISLISTGGTIVSKVEYETGAVKPAITAEELVDMVPELLKHIKELEVVELYRLFSEDITPRHWEKISAAVADKVMEGYDGVVIAHGTDTMSFTASALAFALRNLPVPVILVGAQRSSDRPSSDTILNLRACAITVRNAPFGEVVVAMHGSTSDRYVLIHRGVKVRKMHSSRRDAFQSINDLPLARVGFPEESFTLINSRYIPRSSRERFNVLNRFSSKVFLLKVFPGIDCSIIDVVSSKGFRGLVIEGTGLGHIRNECVETIRRAVEGGLVVVMATQTLFGRVNMKVYTTGRRLIKAGVIPALDMLPEVALVKLSWLLGNYRDRDEVVKLFLSNIANEINELHPHYLFPRWYHEGGVR